jgi:hypothetical protein
LPGQCDAPDPIVKTSARRTEAEAAVRGTPKDSQTLVDVMPWAMPSAPSTI